MEDEETGFRSKNRWLPEEDATLKQVIDLYVETTGNDTNKIPWVELATALPGRTAKQCRERWKSVLDPSLNRARLTPAEMALVDELAIKHNRQWSLIAPMIGNGRSELILRNYYYARQRKLTREAAAAVGQGHSGPEEAGEDGESGNPAPATTASGAHPEPPQAGNKASASSGPAAFERARRGGAAGAGAEADAEALAAEALLLFDGAASASGSGPSSSSPKAKSVLAPPQPAAPAARAAKAPPPSTEHRRQAAQGVPAPRAAGAGAGLAGSASSSMRPLAGGWASGSAPQVVPLVVPYQGPIFVDRVQMPGQGVLLGAGAPAAAAARPGPAAAAAASSAPSSDHDDDGMTTTTAGSNNERESAASAVPGGGAAGAWAAHAAPGSSWPPRTGGPHLPGPRPGQPGPGPAAPAPKRRLYTYGEDPRNWVWPPGYEPPMPPPPPAFLLQAASRFQALGAWRLGWTGPAGSLQAQQPAPEPASAAPAAPAGLEAAGSVAGFKRPRSGSLDEATSEARALAASAAALALAEALGAGSPAPSTLMAPVPDATPATAEQGKVIAGHGSNHSYDFTTTAMKFAKTKKTTPHTLSVPASSLLAAGAHSRSEEEAEEGDLSPHSGRRPGGSADPAVLQQLLASFEAAYYAALHAAVWAAAGRSAGTPLAVPHPAAAAAEACRVSLSGSAAAVIPRGAAVLEYGHTLPSHGTAGRSRGSSAVEDEEGGAGCCSEPEPPAHAPSSSYPSALAFGGAALPAASNRQLTVGRQHLFPSNPSAFTADAPGPTPHDATRFAPFAFTAFRPASTAAAAAAATAAAAANALAEAPLPAPAGTRSTSFVAPFRPGTADRPLSVSTFVPFSPAPPALYFAGSHSGGVQEPDPHRVSNPSPLSTGAAPHLPLPLEPHHRLTGARRGRRPSVEGGPSARTRTLLDDALASGAASDPLAHPPLAPHAATTTSKRSRQGLSPGPPPALAAAPPALPTFEPAPRLTDRAPRLPSGLGSSPASARTGFPTATAMEGLTSRLHTLMQEATPASPPVAAPALHGGSTSLAMVSPPALVASAAASLLSARAPAPLLGIPRLDLSSLLAPTSAAGASASRGPTLEEARAAAAGRLESPRELVVGSGRAHWARRTPRDLWE